MSTNRLSVCLSSSLGGCTVYPHPTAIGEGAYRFTALGLRIHVGKPAIIAACCVQLHIKPRL